VGAFLLRIYRRRITSLTAEHRLPAYFTRSAISAPSARSPARSHSAGKSTLLKLLTGENDPTSGKVTRNGRLRIGYFAQHHLDQLDLDLSPVAFLASKFPGRTEQEYRSHLGGFGITGMTGLQTLGTLSGGQKSRVTFALLSLQRCVFSLYFLRSL
jgi:ATPase subunit of ABC transporter with duplicated ATPase domains